MKEINKLVETIVKGIQEKKGSNITIVDLRDIDGSIANYFVICQGSSPNQIEAISDSIAEQHVSKQAKSLLIPLV